MVCDYYDGADMTSDERDQTGGRVTGGCLHVVLDDENWGDASVAFCLGEAEREGDTAGVALAQALALLTEAERRTIDDEIRARPDLNGLS